MKENVIAAARRAIGELTPLRADCGVLCDCACCKGDAQTGMLLFPGEESALTIISSDDGKLAVCDGRCERGQRPLACMFFPFFPCIDERGIVYVRLDARAMSICPIAANSELVIFDRRFIRAVKRAGRKLAKDAQCREHMRRITEEIEEIARFFEE